MRMEELLSRISEIDAAAANILADADKQKSLLSEELDSRIKKFDAQVEKDTKKQLDDIKVRLDKEAKETLAKLRSSTEKELKRLDSLYQSKHTQMAKEILQNIIKE